MIFSAMYIQKTADTHAKTTYNAIKKHSIAYGVPDNIAFGIAYYETRYCGPDHYAYNPFLVSSGGAVGPMQIIWQYSLPHWPNKYYTAKQLLMDIDFNIETSMRIMSSHYKTTRNWKLALGMYHTGQPVIDWYSRAVYNYKPNFK